MLATGAGHGAGHGAGLVKTASGGWVWLLARCCSLVLVWCLVWRWSGAGLQVLVWCWPGAGLDAGPVLVWCWSGIAGLVHGLVLACVLRLVAGLVLVVVLVWCWSGAGLVLPPGAGLR